MPEACCAVYESRCRTARSVETGQRAGGGGGAEHRAEAVRRMAVLAELVGVERLGQAAADVVAERDRAQERRAVARSRSAIASAAGTMPQPGMRQRRRVRIVGLVGVREHAVGERGVDRRW